MKLLSSKRSKNTEFVYLGHKLNEYVNFIRDVLCQISAYLINSFAHDQNFIRTDTK